MPRSPLLRWSVLRHGPLLVALVFTGCKSGSNPLRASATRDSGAGSLWDGSATSDSLANTTGGEDVAVGTGGSPGSGGSGGSGLDVAGSGGLGTVDASADLVPSDTMMADGIQACTLGGVTYQPGQSITINCVTFTCVSGSSFTGRGTACADAADVSGVSGSGGVAGGGSGGSRSNTGGAASTGGTVGSGGMLGSGGARVDAGVAGAGGSGGVPDTTGPTGDTGGTCGLMTFTLSRRPADVLLVLDRSGSMQYSLAEDCNCPSAAGGSTGSVCSGTANCTDRWTAITSAVGQTITSSSGVQWGLKLFSSPSGTSTCSVVAGVEVPMAANAGAVVQSVLAATAPGNNTPTAAAIAAATTYLKTLSDGNSKAILLATDGQPNCAAGQSSSSSDVAGTVAAISAAYSAGFPVYVIGVGPSVGNLDNMAQAGGTARYYPAISPQQLSDAFAGISSSIATCTFLLANAPPDSTAVYVYVDKQRVPQDAVNGWTFGATNSTIELTGSYCQNLLAAQNSSVQVLLGCGNIPPPIILP